MNCNECNFTKTIQILTEKINELEKENESQKKEIYKHVKQWNNFQLNNNPGSVNAWMDIDKFFETNPEIQDIYNETVRELNKNQCYSKTTAMKHTIKRLLEIKEEYDMHMGIGE